MGPLAVVAAGILSPQFALGAASVYLMESDADGIGGPAALARTGDLLLRNDKIRVVLNAVDHPVGSGLSGGHIIDAAPEGGEDHWGQALFTMSGDFPRQVRYTEMEILEGSRDQVSVVFRGSDSRNDNITIETVYALREGDSFVTVTTEYINNHRRDLDSCITADFVEGGRLLPFLPRFGFLAQGEPSAEEAPPGSSALFFWSEGGVYAWTSGRAAGVTPYQAGTVALPITPFKVLAKESVTLERRFYVWGGDIAGLLGEVDRRNSVPVQGRVVSDRNGDGLPGAWVEIHGEEGILLVAESGPEGRFYAPLPPGIYQAVPTLPSGLSGRGKSFNAALEQSRELRLRLGADGEVQYRVEGENGEGLPAKITIRRPDGTPLKRPSGRRKTPGSYYTRTGGGSINLPEGEYRVTASHGPEYSIDTKEIEIDEGDSVELLFRLEHASPSGDLVAVDLHQRTAASLDCGTTLDELIAASDAAGLDAMVICDRGIAHREVELNREGGPLVIGGEAVVLPGVGSFGIFPLTRENEIKVVGPDGAAGKSPESALRIFHRAGGNPIVQLNTPRLPGQGYFESMGIDPVTGLSTNIETSFHFDLVEVASGTRLDLAASVLRDWFHLLNLGEEAFATGTSGAGSLDPGSVGIPRCYLDLQGQPRSTESIVEALRRGRFFVTTAPLLDVTVNGKGRPGDLVAGGDGLVDLNIRVDAPAWVDVSQVRAFANGSIVAESNIGLSGAETHVQMNESLAIYQDTWIVVVVTGREPLDEIAEGVGGEPVRPVAFSNPVWIDFDLDGQFDLPGVR